MQKKNIIALCLLTILLFLPCLFNGFVGDDEVVVVNNTFYDSLNNIPRLFQKNYLTKAQDLYMYHGSMNSSGSVSYRPLTSLSFFLDNYLWHKNPFGYHLTNILLHLFSVISFYFLINIILENTTIAFIASLLFALHPLQVEAVNNIGYRSDLIAGLLAINSLICFVQYRKDNKIFSLAGAVVLFTFGLFAKEAIVILPLIFLAYDLTISQKQRSMSFYCLVFFIVAVYLVLYFKVFPNTALKSLQLLGGNIFAHVGTIFWIFVLYLKDLIFPVFVKMIPPAYAPNTDHLLLKTILSLCIILAIFISQKIFKTKKVSFFLLWFGIGLLPVMNIIPNPNPMAHRYLYFPSCGFFVVLAIIFFHLIEYCKEDGTFPNIKKVVIILLTAELTFFSLPLVLSWKNNISVGKTLIEKYPNNPKGYAILGIEFCQRGMWNEAKEVLSTGIEKGSEDPRVYYLLGLSCFNQPEIAEKYLKKAIAMNPYFSSPYLALGRMYFFQKNFAQSEFYLEKSLKIFPTYTGYGYLIQAKRIAGQERDAQKLFDQAKDVIGNQGQLDSLERMLRITVNAKPVDIGI